MPSTKKADCCFTVTPPGNGTGQVANPSVIGASGWQGFKSVSGGNGVIYGVVA